MAKNEITVQATRSTRRPAPAIVLVILVSGGLLWIGWTWRTVRLYRAALTAADADMAAGKFGAAARRLEGILASNPRSDEASYVLGICEQQRGRHQAAELAWSRVAPGSSFLQRAILARLRLLHDTGRLAGAEQVVIDASNDVRNDRTALIVLLVPIYSQIGRSLEAARLIEDRWHDLLRRNEATPDESIKLVRLHIELTWSEPSVENLRIYLDQVGRLAPDDDRVWLGRASLAIRTNALDEANRWLDACQRRRPEDLAVWRARLQWAMAARRPDVVQEALKRLPGMVHDRAEIDRVDAWLARARGDTLAERQELERLIAEAPADSIALDRLIQLAEEAGQSARAAELAGKKVEIAAVRARYQKLNDRLQFTRHAEELARLAEQLGSRFEARVFRHLAQSAESVFNNDQLPRLPGRRLFDAVRGWDNPVLVTRSRRVDAPRRADTVRGRAGG